MKLSIPTPRGRYTYRFVPIFEGIKRIDKRQAQENLSLLRDVCERNGLPFLLFFGTLLGAVREHDFIAHDEDIDLVMRKEDMPRFLSLLFELRNLGFEMARYERTGFLSIIRKGEYIDVYFYDVYPLDPSLRFCRQEICRREYVEDTVPYTFLGASYLIPRAWEEFLVYQYGSDWRTPVRYFNYGASRLARLKQWTLQYAKALLPKTFVEKMQSRKDAPQLRARIARLRHNG